MAWKETSLSTLAKSLGVSLIEIRQKQKLIDLIIKTRREKRVSQATLAKKVGVTQSRIAQIESGIGTSTITFDVLFRVLQTLGYEYKIMPRKVA